MDHLLLSSLDSHQLPALYLEIRPMRAKIASPLLYLALLEPVNQIALRGLPGLIASQPAQLRHLRVEQ